MAVYKVPQDVEADDKLIGPFNFRQFIYLIIVTLSLFLAWGLGQLFIPLAIIPLPVIIFFGALALPLRKDQPMEIFMAAMVSFYLKPRRRLWNPDGIETLIEITVPKMTDFQLTKDLSQNEAQRRFSYLAEVVDSRGWAVRGPGIQAPNTAVTSDVYFEAQQVSDSLDNNNATTQAIDFKLSQSEAKRHQDMIDLLHGKPNIPSPNYFNGTPSETISAPEPVLPEHINYNPYPIFQQSVIQPLSQPIPNIPKPIQPTTSEKAVSTDIINLARNTDLSIEAIAREAGRINQRLNSSEEVIISLR